MRGNKENRDERIRELTEHDETSPLILAEEVPARSISNQSSEDDNSDAAAAAGASGTALSAPTESLVNLP
jgi:hypothetical protein